MFDVAVPKFATLRTCGRLGTLGLLVKVKLVPDEKVNICPLID